MLDVADSSHLGLRPPVSHPARRSPTRSDGRVTHSGVLTESAALIQRRLGMHALRHLLEVLLPSLEIVWIDAELHRLASTALLAAGHRRFSLVDWTSFTVMRERSITHAFAFDEDFERQGFETFQG